MEPPTEDYWICGKRLEIGVELIEKLKLIVTNTYTVGINKQIALEPSYWNWRKLVSYTG